MKKIVLFLGLSLVLGQRLFAQSSALINQDFWKAKPNLELIKSELSKGFDFKAIQGYEDPLLLAINNDMPVAVIKYLADQPGIDFNRKIHDGRNYLHTTVGKNMLDVTAYLVSKGSNPNMLDVNGQTPMTFAAYGGSLKLEMLQLLEKLGVDVLAKYPRLNNANLLLVTIGSDKDLSITKYLISKGLSLNSTDDKGNNAFYYAARYGNHDVMKFVVSEGIKPTDDALFTAAAGIRWSAPGLDVFKYLVEDLKLNVHVKDAFGASVLNYVVKKTNRDDVVAYLLNLGVELNALDKSGNSVIYDLAKGRDIAIVKSVLPNVKNINVANEKGETPLLNAIKNGSPEMVALLIENGADIKAVDKEGNTAAYYLVHSFRTPEDRGYRNFEKLDQPAELKAKLNTLIGKGLDIKAKQSESNNVFIIAAGKNSLPLLKTFEGLNFDINAQNEHGFTALHQAAMKASDVEVLQYLVAQGANLKLKTELDETAWDLASENEVLKANKTNIDFLK